MKKILVAVDGSEESNKALARAKEIAEGLNSEVVLLRVQRLAEILHSNAEMEELKKSIERSPLRRDFEKKSMEILDKAEAALEIKKVKKIFKWGHPVEEILKVAEEEKADMIVLGSRGRRRGILLGSVSREVAERAKIPVLIGR